jgi:DNA-binding transcriptional ArsR family regulator
MSGQGAQDHPPVADLEQRAVFSIGEQVAELRRLAQAEAQGRAEVERYVAASRDRERRIVMAIRALEGIAPRAKAKPAAKPNTGTKISAERTELIFQTVREAGEPVSTQRLVEATELAQSQVSAGLRVLREEGRIRLAGKDESSKAPVKPNLYAVMPDVD